MCDLANLTHSSRQMYISNFIMVELRALTADGEQSIIGFEVTRDRYL